MVYEWKVPIYDIPAQTAGEELERIKGKHGVLSPEAIVEESKDSCAVLHGCFEWDNLKAAEKYRIAQAAQIVRTLTVNVQSEDNQPVSVRAFVSVSGGYEAIGAVVSVPDMYDALLAEAKKELAAFQQKYRAIKSLSKVMSEIDAIMAD